MTRPFLRRLAAQFRRREVIGLLVAIGLVGVVVVSYAIQSAGGPPSVAQAGGDGTTVPVPGAPPVEVPFQGACTSFRTDDAGAHVVHLDNAGSANGEQGVVGSYRIVGDVVESGILVGDGDGSCLQEAFPCAWKGGTRSDVLGASDDGKMAALFGFMTPDDEIDAGAHGSRWTFEVRSYAKTADGSVWVSSLQRPVVVYAHDTPGGTYEPAYYCDVEAAGLV